MSAAIFLPDDFTEVLEIEARLAHGRDGRGADRSEASIESR
jgi:hypothetical protein